MRAGRYLEQLTGQLEHLLGSGTLIVRSPEYIPNRHTGDRVEVDVTLRGKIGSTDILVAIECRDRSGRQDINWIRELATKKDDIGASAIVAVSSNGFSKDASAEAAVRGVIIKTLSRLSEEEIAKAILGLQVNIFRPVYLFKGFGDLSFVPFMIHVDKPAPMLDVEELWKLARNPSERGLYDKKDEKWISFSELLERGKWKEAIQNVKIGEKVTIEVPIPSTFESHWRSDEPHYHLYNEDEPDSFIGLCKMNILAEVWYEAEPAELSAAFKYSEDDHCIARVAEFNLAPIGRPADVLQVFFINGEPNPDAHNE